MAEISIHALSAHGKVVGNFQVLFVGGKAMEKVCFTLFPFRFISPAQFAASGNERWLKFPYTPYPPTIRLWGIFQVLFVGGKAMEIIMETTVYTVRKGDTLFGIANFFGTTVDKILSVNSIQDPAMIYIGQTINVPVDTERQNGYIYVTRPGDTLWSIAQKFGTTVDEIAKKNGMLNPNIIYPGTRLYI